MIPLSYFACRPMKRAHPLSNIIKLLLPPPYLHGISRYFTSSHGLLRDRERKSPFMPSQEQLKIVRLCATQNVVVSARPGSGKTATAEAIAAAYPDKRVALLTYTKALQLEIYRRASAYPNFDTFTFHGMASRLFHGIVCDNSKLSEQRRRVFHEKELPQWNSEPYDIIVLDEFQDCTDILFWLAKCFILANNQKMGGQPARLVVLGDERQAIYRFRGADHRYLTLAHELLRPVSPYPFARVSLSRSFRLSAPSVRFINNVFLNGESYITSSKAGPKPIVLRCGYRDKDELAKTLSALIDEYRAENTAILSPSTRKNGPLKQLVNTLAEIYGVPINPPTDDEAPLDDRVPKGKLCVSTIHQFKGSERDLIILFGINSSFFGYCGRDVPDDSCPNLVFVALTRAAKQLVLVHLENDKVMPFVSVDALYETANVVNMTGKREKISSPDASGRPLEYGLSLPRLTGVRELTGHVRDECLVDIMKRDLRIKQISPPLPKDEHISIRDVVPSDTNGGLHEAVSDINGLVVVAAFEHDMLGTLETLSLDKSIVESQFPVCHQQQVSWLCRNACDYEALLSGYRPRAIQMQNHRFDWIKPEDLALARSRLRKELRDSAPNFKFEVEVEREFNIGSQKTQIAGQADIVAYSSTSNCNDGQSVDSIWEIKFVLELTNEHILQACMYAYLFPQKSEKLPRIMLYNVRDGQKLEITPRDGREGLRRMIESILRLKFTTTKEKSDKAFIEMCAKTTQELTRLHNVVE